jgi:hypothetical protein|tara:strand:+ start:52 stop:303 length:252 start_codon:yes stop_codon:yes gene_type:complete
MGSRPSAPVTYRPTPTAPVIYQSVIPEEDFERTTEYINELKGERAKKKAELESQGFGAADMAARQKSYLQAEQDAYSQSLKKP